MDAPDLQAIDCILYTVPDAELDAAKEEFETVLGLDRVWERDGQVGYKLEQHADGVGEIVLSTDTDVPDGLVHYLVEDAERAIEYYADHDYEVVHGPIDIGVGTVATVQNSWGHEFEIMDLE
ncbi:VOC family protein [Halobacterium zhouii]|uniref:VOC family protein n=1 Tax=Halobacterium zhouii TaxID=2902624 RepID=UPI001E2FADCC|nr:VOC family protein [Halobacterium zhouii]